MRGAELAWGMKRTLDGGAKFNTDGWCIIRDCSSSLANRIGCVVAPFEESLTNRTFQPILQELVDTVAALLLCWRWPPLGLRRVRVVAAPIARGLRSVLLPLRLEHGVVADVVGGIKAPAR
jgi:hypothetical protein